MKTSQTRPHSTFNKSQSGAFSLVEVMVGTAIIAIFFISFFATLGNGFSIVKASRENLRATQIMLNRLEGIRLYTWDNLGTVPTANITEYYAPNSANNQGAAYTVTMSIAGTTITPTSTYSANSLKKVTVNVAWTSGGKSHTRSLSTYVSKFGMQNYIFADAN